MEKLSIITKTLNEVKQKGICLNQLTTDRHTGIRKYMREEESKRLHQVGKNKSCKNLQKWTKSISNHFWWACATCKGDEQLLREKWLSVLLQMF